MKQLLAILMMMTMTNLVAQDGKATTVKETFNRETSVYINIKSNAAIIWTLLTHSADFSRWNSTVISIDGEIKLGEKILLKSVLDEKKVFKLKVKEFEIEKRMVWGDGKGSRVYTLIKNEDGSITFSMVEKIGGLMFPMYAKYIPSFDESFTQFAEDLKKEAELIHNTK